MRVAKARRAFVAQLTSPPLASSPAPRPNVHAQGCATEEAHRTPLTQLANPTPPKPPRVGQSLRADELNGQRAAESRKKLPVCFIRSKANWTLQLFLSFSLCLTRSLFQVFLLYAAASFLLNSTHDGFGGAASPVLLANRPTKARNADQRVVGGAALLLRPASPRPLQLLAGEAVSEEAEAKAVAKREE